VPVIEWLLVAVAAAVLLYGLVVLALMLAGRSTDARAVAGFIPDCLVLFKRLLADPRVPRRRKALILPLIAYLAMPFDLVPDFIPVVGQLDDAIVVAFVLRRLVRGADRAMLREHWPGPEASLRVIHLLAFGQAS
jgi:uncharacterized membrane protein YkvA (DUF1232 family)